MSNKFKAKLNSARGATMIMAMLMLLLAVFVSSMALTGSVTAVRNKRNERTQLQNKLLLSSAADYICREIERRSVIIVRTDVERFNEEGQSMGFDPSDYNIYWLGLENGSVNFLTQGVIASGYYHSPSAEVLTFTIDEVDTAVRAELNMDKEFNLTIYLSMCDALELAASHEVPSGDTELITIYFSPKISDAEPRFEEDKSYKKDAHGNPVKNDSITTRTTTYETTYTWEKPEIIKGWEK